MATPDQVEEKAEGAGAETGAVHGGRLVARAMKSRGASKLFTLSGGHLFSIYDGCKAEGIEVVDFRHEQSAAFAAIGWAKATREPGICALTAGCGVTNGMSAIASAQADGVPLVTLGGRAPEMRWGMGSLQEIDHLPFVTPLAKSAMTVKDPREDRPHHRGGDRHRAPSRRSARPSSTTRSTSSSRRPRPRSPTRRRCASRSADGVEEAAKLLAEAGAAGDHGRHQPLLGPGRGRAARAGRGARHPGLPQRTRAAAASRPTTSSTSPAPAAPRSRAATSPW